MSNAPTAAPPSDVTPVPEDTARRYEERGVWTDDLIGDIAAHAAADPTLASKPAVADATRRLSYAELEDEATRLALGWRELGLRRGDRVILQLPNSVEFLTSLLSLLKAGLVPIMALPDHREAELGHFAQHAEALAYISPVTSPGLDHLAAARRLGDGSLLHVVVPDATGPGPAGDVATGDGTAAGAPSAAASWGGAARIGGPTLSYGDVLARGEAATSRGASLPSRTTPGTHGEPRASARDLALLQLSGGSTGTPKLIPRTHADYLCSVRASLPWCGIDADTVYLCVLPAAHNFALSSAGVLGALMAGGTVIMTRDPSPATCFALIREEGVTVAGLVPPLALLWLSAASRLRAAGTSVPRLRSLQVGGARLSDEAARRIGPELGCTLQQVFGMAEGLVNYTGLDEPLDLVTTTQGRPMHPLDEVRVVDDEGRDVPDGEPGHLLARGPYTIRGYYRAPEHNRTAFTEDGFYRTGDIVVRRPTGHLSVVGRSKDQINRGGEKIASEEVQNHLLAHPGILEAAVVGEADPALGERVVAHLLLEPGPEGDALRGLAAPRLITSVRAHLSGRGLARYKLPDKVFVGDSLPRTAVGKTRAASLQAGTK
ncbi:MAG: AMP-binding protein [Arthrobacter sp.]|jgi:2,3-dihydroxybenzoate-AMP ligase|nr:AMP-binding protein [Arthrobacter sp.]